MQGERFKSEAGRQAGRVMSEEAFQCDNDYVENA